MSSFFSPCFSCSCFGSWVLLFCTVMLVRCCTLTFPYRWQRLSGNWQKKRGSSPWRSILLSKQKCRNVQQYSLSWRSSWLREAQEWTALPFLVLLLVQQSLPSSLVPVSGPKQWAGQAPEQSLVEQHLQCGNQAAALVKCSELLSFQWGLSWNLSELFFKC